MLASLATIDEAVHKMVPLIDAIGREPSSTTDDEADPQP